MIAGSLVAYYIERKFPSLPKGKLGTIIATAQFCSSLGNIFASSLARRIGLIKTSKITNYKTGYTNFKLTIWPYSGVYALAQRGVSRFNPSSIFAGIDYILFGSKSKYSFYGPGSTKCILGCCRPSERKNCSDGNSQHRYVLGRKHCTTVVKLKLTNGMQSKLRVKAWDHLSPAVLRAEIVSGLLLS